MYKFFLASCFTLFGLSSLLSAQSLTGVVSSTTGDPVEFASLQLLRAADSSFVTGASSGADGTFRFQNFAPGEYCVRAVLIGYADVFSPLVSVKSGDVLALEPIVLAASMQLKEATVTARLPSIERLVDKIVVNVEGSALAAGNNALELLQRAPGVFITPQGSVMLDGKSGVMVMVDGKPTQLSGDQLLAYLQSIPAETIAKLELIARPSSKYDAEGASGIINIKLKKNQQLGLNGNLSGGITQSIHARLRGGLNLNYRPGKVNFFGNASVVDGGQSVGQSIERYAAGKRFDQQNPLVEHFGTKAFKAGADYFASEKHTIGVLVQGNFYQNDALKDNVTRISNEGSVLVDSTLRSSIDAPSGNDRLTYNVNYRFADTLGNELTFDADAIAFRSDGTNTLDNQRFNSENLPVGQDAQFSDLRSDIMVLSLKTDYVKTRKDGLKLETGAKLNWTNADNNIQSTRTEKDVTTPDAGRTNRFNYRENISAAYANVGKNGAKINWQLGLRAERTSLSGQSTDLYGTVLNNPDTAYLGLFPTAYLQYTLKPMHQLGLSYNRRLSRPAYQDMNPFVWQTDAYTSERGNPYLRPQYNHTIELSYTYKYAASVSLGYNRATDVVTTIARQVGDQAYTQPQNLSRQDNVSLNFNLPLPIKPWWEGYLWLGVWHNTFQSALADGPLDVNTFGGGCYLSQDFKLGHGYRVEGSFWAQFPTQEGIFRNRGIASASAGIKKALWSNKASIKLAMNDLFGTQRWSQSANFGTVRGTIINTWESQNIALNFSWNFGNQNLKARNRDGGAGGEEGRIKGRRE